ncbi:Gluconate transporter [Pseudomonas syringae pv. actinidiae]|uniref:Gluconate transporter n=1 Tax=Pseudomonas syringae pv. actinidiae TaxID=103796 RepID=A0A7Z6UCM8_PSESF|nr:hypothetical protein [Pseudomonas syringae]RMP83189.1 Gluconate transporter [Pseudomonas syringae pv. actinidiae]
MHIEEPVELGELFSAKPDTRRQPGFDISLLIILLPVILMVREYFGQQLKQNPLVRVGVAGDCFGRGADRYAVVVALAGVKRDWRRQVSRLRHIW